MVCRKCGINNSDDSKYCFSCGARLGKRHIAGIIVGAVLGAIILLLLQFFAARFVIDKFLFSNTSEIDSPTRLPSHDPKTNYYGDDTYDEYDWWGNDDQKKNT